MSFGLKLAEKQDKHKHNGNIWRVGIRLKKTPEERDAADHAQEAEDAASGISAVPDAPAADPDQW